MLPSKWVILSADDICHSVSVGIVITPKKYYVEEDKGIKTFRSANVREGYINDSNWVYISEEGHKINKKSEIFEGDLLVVRTGYPGTACVVTKEFEGSNAIDIVIARPNMDKVLPEFLCAFTNSHLGKSQVLNLQGGMAQQHLNVGAYKTLLVKLPPLVEQTKIAQILSTWDQAIATTEKLIKNSKAQKKALMQQLLTGKKRLPGFSGEWQEYCFNQIFDRLKRKNTVDNDNILTISGKDGLVSQKEYFNKRVASENLQGYTLLHRGDFAYNKSYSNGYPYGAIKPLGRYDAGVVSSLYICFNLIKPDDHEHDFFRHFFEGGYFDREIYAIAQEGARNHGLLNVSSTAFFITRLRIPPLSEQTAIADVINTAEADQHNLEQQLQSLKLQKKALMQQLLTGKRRVKVSP